jgi:hypothetical protein
MFGRLLIEWAEILLEVENDWNTLTVYW